MPATQAQALVPDMIVQLATPDEDADALLRLGLWAIRRYAPAVAVDAPDGLVMDCTGVAHLFGSEAAMLEDVSSRLRSSRIAPRSAIAPTWGAAFGLARYRKQPQVIVAQDELADALAPLPLAALRLDPETVAQLRRLGFETIGELNATARAPIAHRFGQSLLARIDQAYGRAGEPFIPLELPELPRVTRGYPEPISAPETLKRYVGILAEQMAAFLEERSLGATQIDMLFFRIDSRLVSIRCGFSQAMRDPARMIRHLGQRLETVDPGPGVERMTLVASRTDKLTMRPGSALGEAPERDVSELVDILAGRVGEDRLYRLAAVESDIPERSVTRIPPLSGPTELRWPLEWPRPSRLLPSPELVETVALMPDHPPVQFTWRGVRRRVKRADGPERIYGEWIRSSSEMLAVRDYFAVEDESGERFWLFRSGDGEHEATGDLRWYIHGLFG